jgi:hypothetical protein
MAGCHIKVLTPTTVQCYIFKMPAQNSDNSTAIKVLQIVAIFSCPRTGAVLTYPEFHSVTFQSIKLFNRLDVTKPPIVSVLEKLRIKMGNL